MSKALDPPVAGRRVPAPSPEEPVVALDAVTRSFEDVVAVHDVTLHVPRGVIVGLIGPSGSGKTTLIRIVVGLLVPSEGTVTVFGRDPTSFGRRTRQRVGYLPQSPVLFPNLSLVANLRFVASLYGVKGRGRRAHLQSLLEFVGLREHQHTLLSHASGGMRRRLTLAATLVHDPELIVLDEPTAGIDPILRARFWDRFRDLRSEGRTLLVSTQYVGEAAECDVVAMLVDGGLVALDTPEALVRQAYPDGPPCDADGREQPVDWDDAFVHLVRRAKAHRRAEPAEPVEPVLGQVVGQVVEADR